MKRIEESPGAALALGFILAVVGMLLSLRADADEFKLPAASCYPLISANTVDTRLYMKEQTDVLRWWCSTPTGLEPNYRTGNFGYGCEQCFREDITLDELSIMDRAAFRRPPSPAEQVAADKAWDLYAPRCVIASTAKTTQVRGAQLDRTIGPARVDEESGKVIRISTTQLADCHDWMIAGKITYCSVTAQPDTLGRPIPMGSYVQCKVTLAPKQGWPQ